MKKYAGQSLKTFLLIFLAITGSVILSGCFTYYEIPKEEFLKREQRNRIKLSLNNQQNILIEKDQLITTSPDSITIIQNDSSSIKISFNDVNQIQEEQFDSPKTFFAGFWIGLVTLTVIGLIALWISGGFK